MTGLFVMFLAFAVGMALERRSFGFAFIFGFMLFVELCRLVVEVPK